MMRILSLNDRTRRPSNQPRSGVILFVVIIVIAMAALAGYTYVVAVQGDNTAAHLGADQLQAEHLAASGEAFVSAWLSQPRSVRAELDENLGPEVFAQIVTRPTTTAGATAANTTSIGRFYIVQPRQPGESGASQRSNNSSFGGSTMPQTTSRSSSSDSSWQPGVVNESGKLHLGTLLHWDQIWPGSGRNALLNLPGMSSETADAILDWMDADNEPREYGAESDVYTKQPQSYRAANKIPNSLEELLLVRGVNRRLLFGDTSGASPKNEFFGPGSPLPPTPNQNSGDRSNVASPFGRSNQQTRPWSDFLTVYSGERDQAYDGSKRIFVNGKDIATLQSALEEVVDEDVAKFILLYRQYGRVNPIVVPTPETEAAIDELANTANEQPDDSTEVIETNESNANANSDAPPSNPGSNEEPEGDYLELDQVELKEAPPQIALINVLDLLDAIVPLPPEESEQDNQDGEEAEETEAPTPRFVRSPITTKELGNKELAAAMDRLTLVEKPAPVYGRLNLYLAPIEIIAGLPLLESGQAAQIEAARDTADPIQAQQGLAWLYRSDVLEPTVLYALSPYLTAGGDVVSFETIGVHGRRRLHHRYAAILDGTYAAAVRRVAFRDLRREGYPSIFDDLPTISGTSGGTFTTGNRK